MRGSWSDLSYVAGAAAAGLLLNLVLGFELTSPQAVIVFAAAAAIGLPAYWVFHKRPTRGVAQ
jgi:hypothetical protein